LIRRPKGRPPKEKRKKRNKFYCTRPFKIWACGINTNNFKFYKLLKQLTWFECISNLWWYVIWV